jgi:hypothetical protein
MNFDMSHLIVYLSRPLTEGDFIKNYVVLYHKALLQKLGEKFYSHQFEENESTKACS